MKLKSQLSRSQAAAESQRNPAVRAQTLYPASAGRSQRGETSEPQLSKRNPVSTGRNPTLRARKGWQTVIALGLVGSAATMSALNWLQPALFSTSVISGTLLISVLLGIIIVTKSRYVS